MKGNTSIELYLSNFTDYITHYSHQIDKPEGFDWYNRIYRSKIYKWTHIEHYNNGKVEVLHIVTMPNATSNMPIFGLDVVAINGKITMICCDFTPIGRPFYKVENPFENDRALPEWATFFSDDLLLIRPKETQIEPILWYYFEYYKKYILDLAQYDIITEPKKNLVFMNSYVQNQRKNTSTLKALSADIGKEKAEEFINNYLFPDITLSKEEQQVQDVFDFGVGIRKQTNEEHIAAEKTQLSIDLVQGTISEVNYANYLHAQYTIFKEFMRVNDYYVTDIYNLLMYDYLNLNVEHNIKRMDSLESYKNYLHHIDVDTLKGHIYTFALAHCYGGYYIAKKLNMPKLHLTNLNPKTAYSIRKLTHNCNVEDVRDAFIHATKIYEDIYETTSS